MKIYTLENPPGFQISKCIGLVRGSTVRARHLGDDIAAGLRMIAGGEIPEYTKILAESREQALDRMIEEAESLGAHAVVGVRFVTSPIVRGAAELLAYGTAVEGAAMFEN